MKQLPKLKLLFGIFSIIAALLSVIIVVREFINIQPSVLSLLVGIAGTITGAILAFGIGLFSDKKFVAKVFISYSMKDSDFVSKLTKDLMRNGFQVLTLDNVVLVGDNIREKVVDSIQNADFFVVVMSKDAVESSWVSDELEFAIKNNKRVLPVLKEKIDLPSKIKSIQYADFTADYNSAISALLKSLQASFHDSKKQPV